jgi:hypothetical protein
MAVKRRVYTYIHTHTHTHTYWYFITAIEISCRYTPEPRVPNCSELGFWGLGSTWGASPIDRCDGVVLGEQRGIAPIGPLIELSAPSEGPRSHEVSHHATILELVPDSVCMVWV